MYMCMYMCMDMDMDMDMVYMYMCVCVCVCVCENVTATDPRYYHTRNRHISGLPPMCVGAHGWAVLQSQVSWVW